MNRIPLTMLSSFAATCLLFANPAGAQSASAVQDTTEAPVATAPTDPSAPAPVTTAAAPEPTQSDAGPASEAKPVEPPALGEPATSAAAEPATAPPPTEEESSLGLNLDVQVASAYVWRGANLWGPEHDSQNLSVFPGAKLSVGDLYAGYWGAYQITGETKGDKVDAGVGAEQDLYVGYGVGLTEGLTLGLLATYYIYPFAEEDVAGVKTPMYLEPLVSLLYSTAVDVGLSVSYYRGLQDASDLISHVYISPGVAKSVELSETLSLGLSASFGYKVWTNGDWDTDLGNNWDVLGNAGITYSFGDLYVSPAVHVAFTDVAEGAKKGEGLAYWGGANIGYNLAF